MRFLADSPTRFSPSSRDTRSRAAYRGGALSEASALRGGALTPQRNGKSRRDLSAALRDVASEGFEPPNAAQSDLQSVK